MANETLKAHMKKNKVYQWQIAELFGVNEVTLCKKLRKPLDEKTEKQFYNAIDYVIKQRETA